MDKKLPTTLTRGQRHYSLEKLGANIRYKTGLPVQHNHHMTNKTNTEVGKLSSTLGVIKIIFAFVLLSSTCVIQSRPVAGNR